MYDVEEILFVLVALFIMIFLGRYATKLFMFFIGFGNTHHAQIQVVFYPYAGISTLAYWHWYNIPYHFSQALSSLYPEDHYTIAADHSYAF